MVCDETSCAKQACLLSLNQICEIVMDWGSDEAECNTSSMEDGKVEPCPPLAGSTSSH